MKKTIGFRLFSIALLSLALLASSCMNMKKEALDRRFFVLDVSRPEEQPAPAAGEVLRIGHFRVSPRCDGRAFVYRIGELQYEPDFYNQFFTSPELIIAEEVREWLSRSGLYARVTGSASRLEPTYVLEANVVGLFGDSWGGGDIAGVLEIQFFLTDLVSGRSRVRFQSTYRREVFAGGRSPQKLVAAWNTALRQILTELEDDLREHLQAP